MHSLALANLLPHQHDSHAACKVVFLSNKLELLIETSFTDLSTTANEENEETNESEIDQLSATNIFFRRDSDENFDKIIEELVKACQETKKKDAAQQQNAANMAEDFPLLSEQVPTSSAPHWPNVSINRTFSAGLRDGRIELGFHVTGSEVLFRLTGGKLSSAETGNQSFHSSGKLCLLLLHEV